MIEAARRSRGWCWLFLWLSALSSLAAEQPLVPLERAHAHNDYEHQRPLLDALDHGFCSVEADIYLVKGQLLVAHEPSQTSPSRTLQSLYLDPLRERARKNGGRVYPNGPTITLLIDIKSEAESTYQVLREVLKDYAEVLSSFNPESMEPRAVTVVLSGNRPRAILKKEPLRYAAFDGRLPDLDSGESKSFMPLVSDNWTVHFRWRGNGPFPTQERQRLRETIAKAHGQGRQVRFWATPDNPVVWKELFSAGADLINTDDLKGLQTFLLSEIRPTQSPAK